jgi:Tfp pilus assembly protein PilF
MLYQEKKFVRLFPYIIFLVSLLQYANTIGHDYAWDDKLVITGNEYTQQGAAGLYDIFTKKVSVPYKNVYRPVPQALFALEYDWFNQNPHASHFFSVVWYALCCVVLYWFIRFVLPVTPPIWAFIATIFFAFHPLHVEVVANIKSRDETLALLFGLLSVIWATKSISGKPWWMVPALIAFVIAFLSKENVITLLPIIFLAYWWRSPSLKLNFRVVAVCSVIVVAGIALVYWINYSISSRADDTMQLDATVLNNIFLWTTESGKVIPTSIANIGRYLQLFVFPHPLIHLYGYNQISLTSWWSWQTLLVLVLLFWTARWLFRNIKHKRPAAFGILFFICTYSVYSNFFKRAPDTMADRYLFFPSVGLVIILTDLLFYLAVDFSKIKSVNLRKQLAIGISSIFIVGFFVRTLYGNKDWENDYTLIYNRIQYMEDNAAAQATYGLMLSTESETLPIGRMRTSKRREAMKAFTRSVEIYPDFYWSWVSIGKIFTEEKFYDKAELAFLKAQRLEPMTSDSYFCLGSLYYTVNSTELSITYLEKAIIIDPSVERCYVMLGKAYLQGNNIDNLRSLSESAIRRFPGNAEFYALMASYYFKTNQFKESEFFLNEALKRDPRNMTAQILRSTIQLKPHSH